MLWPGTLLTMTCIPLPAWCSPYLLTELVRLLQCRLSISSQGFGFS